MALTLKIEYGHAVLVSSGMTQEAFDAEAR